MEQIHEYIKQLALTGGFSKQDAQDIANDAIQIQTSAIYILLSNKEPKEVVAMTKALKAKKD